MYKPDDNDIDRLGRDAAERYNAPGTPAWDSLRQRLDKELPHEEEKKRRGFFFFMILIGLLLGGSAVFYGIHAYNKTGKAISSATTVVAVNKTNKTDDPSAAANNKETAALNLTTENDSPVNTTAGKPAVSTKNTDDKADKPLSLATASVSTPQGNQQTKDNTADIKLTKDTRELPKKPDPKTSTVPVPEKNSIAVKNHLTNKITAGSLDKITAEKNNHTKSFASVSAGASKQKPVYASTIRKKNSNNVSATSNNIDSKDLVPASNKKNKHGNNKSGTKNKQVPENGTENAAAGDLLVNNSSTKEDNQTSIDLGTDSKASEPAPDTISDKITSVAGTVATTIVAAEKKDSVTTTIAKKKDKPQSSRAINIGLTAGLDQSTVKFTHGSNAGYNIGITGGYQFSKHWSVYTGAIYTKKNYKLNGNDYHPPTHYWTQYVNLETVDGYCNMWEIPLQARYTFSSRSKTAFFISTGLSSYFMKKQAYNYSYKNSMNMPAYTAWSLDSGMNHIFSILDLSAGFEKQMGKHMNLQVEPYAKIPLGGIGFGNIKLSSFGINLTLQYRKPVKR